MKTRTSVFTLVLVLFFIGSVKGQETIVEDINYNKLQRYIELAKQNYPRKKIFEAQEQQAKNGVPYAQMGYLESLEAAYYYRPNDKAAIDIDNPYAFNGFQFGVTVNVGTILRTPFAVKQAKAQYKVTQLETQEYDITLASEVKRRYYDYILALKDLKVKTNGAQDAYSLLENLRYKFEKAEITHESYSVARTALTEAETNKLAAEATLLKAKDALEEMIGAKLEEVKE